MRTNKSAYAFLAILAALTLLGCPVTGGDAVAPTVGLVVPADLAVDVAPNASITATFSEEMDESTIAAANFTLMAGAVPVAGVVSYAGLVATFNPDVNLAIDTEYTATVGTGVKDLSGNALASAKVWTFTTGSVLDTTPPAVSLTVPAALATNVAVNANIVASFSESMDPLTIGEASFTLMAGATPVTGAVSYVGLDATFDPNANLLYETEYTATVTIAACDLAGNALALAKVWTFTTGTELDTIAPVVSGTMPLDAAVQVGVGDDITATFSEAMLGSSVNNLTFTVAGSAAVSGVVSYAGLTATFNPDAALASGTLYTVTITTGATDLAGNGLAGDKVWTFTTETQGPAAVALGTAGNYLILAETAITETTGSSLVGDIGISPNGLSSITGFAYTAATGYATAANITGFIYAADMALDPPLRMTDATADKRTAYGDAQGRTPATGPNLNRASVGGTTFTPGLYTWTASLPIDSTIYINGGAADVWIFQVNGDLTLAGATKIILQGGALASNIFWQVTGYANLAAGCEFEGILMTEGYITMGDVTKFHGRAFSWTAVNLGNTDLLAP